MDVRDWLGRFLPLSLVELFAVALFGLLAGLLARARSSARDIPFSPVFGGSHIGADFSERRGIATGEEPVGEMDDMAAYDRETTVDGEGFDADAVDPTVRDFYERTAAYAMAYRTRWHRGFRTGAALAAPLTDRIEQLNLPGPDDSGTRRLRSRFASLRSSADPRDGARAWVRTDPETREAVFVALYASHAAESDGADGEQQARERFVNIAAPLPGGNLSTVLRIRQLPTDASGGSGVELTTWTDGDPGLYLVTPLGAVELPLQQRFRVWPVAEVEGDAAGERDGPPEPLDPRASLVAAHEMWAFGRRFLTVEYAMWEAEEPQ